MGYLKKEFISSCSLREAVESKILHSVSESSSKNINYLKAVNTEHLIFHWLFPSEYCSFNMRGRAEMTRRSSRRDRRGDVSNHPENKAHEDVQNSF